MNFELKCQKTEKGHCQLVRRRISVSRFKENLVVIVINMMVGNEEMRESKIQIKIIGTQLRSSYIDCRQHEKESSLANFRQKLRVFE